MTKNFWCVLALALGLESVFAFTPAGPSGNGGDSWQTPDLAYGQIKGPKNIGEEYRRNVPVMYYAFDATFYGYFGLDGASGVDNAFAILNNLTNVDSYTKTLSEFSLESRHLNYRAQALGLLDIKSYTLGLMMEQLGLANPVQYAWTLHDRGGTPCPSGIYYNVVQRNFDFTSSPVNQLQYSPYVNNTLYTYQILEYCTGTPLAETYPYAVDPLANVYSPVASFERDYPGVDILLMWWGDYYTGLTRDDVAGLRYLMSTNNINWESSYFDSLQVITNTSVQQLFPVYSQTNGGGWYNYGDGITYGTASYPALLNFAQTNAPAALQAAYPGLQFTLISNYYALVWITNTVSYYTNFYGSASPSLIIKKVPTQAFIQYFIYQFENIVTNLYSSTTKAKLQTITVKPLIGAPLGSPLVTNISTKKVTLKIPDGEFYILPTNSPCGVQIVSAFAFTNYTTNVITSTSTVTNTVTGTGTGTNAATVSGYAYSQNLVIQSVSHVYVVHPVTCDATNQATGLMRGLGQLSFVRADYDSWLGQYWQPVTNDYAMTMITNSKAVTLHFRRIVTEPDFLFAAADQYPAAVETRNLNFDESNVLPGLAGPGTIVSPTLITFDKAGPGYFNANFDVMNGDPYFTQTPGGDLTDLFYSSYYVWANYDGTTNDPVVFPNGTSLDNLANQILIQVSPQAVDLPVATVGVNYGPITFTATGGSFTQPYSWSASLLPAGMTLSPTGTLSGTPTETGTFDFVLTLTDYVGRSVSWSYSLIVQDNIAIQQ